MVCRPASCSSHYLDWHRCELPAARRLSTLLSAAGDLASARTAATKELYVPWPEDKREAFIIPSDVTYLARACDPRTLEIETDGTWSVASNALSYDYLWNEIRVKGGAYGCGFRSPSPRHASFYTYRDPAIDPSLARIEAAGDWLASFDRTPTPSRASS
ncbi:MAG: hypothetical protein ACLTKG_03440 [Collinsella intestinalis]